MTKPAFLQRTYRVDGVDVACRFFRPEQEGGSFFCRYEIDWPEGSSNKRVGGVDEIQSLLLAMQLAHSDFLAARLDDAREVSWGGDTSLGLPIAKTIRDLDPDNRF